MGNKLRRDVTPAQCVQACSKVDGYHVKAYSALTSLNRMSVGRLPNQTNQSNVHPSDSRSSTSFVERTNFSNGITSFPTEVSSLRMYYAGGVETRLKVTW